MVDGPNLYLYCNNDPVNFVDLWGLCKEKKEPWWIKLEEGEYYGTGFGTTATEWYAQRYLETNNWLWTMPGSIASLWTPETWMTTTQVLIAGYEVGNYFGRPYYQYYPKGNEGYTSPYLTRGRGWNAPYSPGTGAAEKLSLPPYNPGTAVRTVRPNPFKYIKGPSKVVPKFGRTGGGTEYIIQ